ncbi:hypothetical protein SUGI_0394590 [Cryptomeria japonica]|uniref:abscisic acid 8'-hydroxylase CYP707A2 isoform X2 n=1 Tax=Cryptomeria japonica TaxID=3369 RepID=UPI002408ED6A|nr:abscisic acid 8'-hydroxylase CYP707A2 isoform X2 [Cryptomeria japonica]GLJ21424.1 hypothetical protein SUGI_0394590 [Cryptomeria japonica]
MMEFSLSILIWCVVVCVLLRLWRRYKEFVRWKVLQLPPGTMGWPYVGETFKLYSQNPNVFFADKQKRYGDIFKTHILGCPCVMIARPESAKFVLASQAHLFKPTFPASKERMLGPQALFFHQGDYHAQLRKLVKLSFLPEANRQIVPDIEARALLALHSWEDRTLNTFHEMKRFSFDVAFVSIFGRHDVLEKEEIKQYYNTLEKGYNSMPLNLPGTLFHKAMKARKQLSKILSKIICERKSSSCSHEGLLETMMRSSEQPLSDSKIADNIIGVIFAAHDTTASVLTWVIKYLTDNAPLLEAVTAEQEAILGEKGGEKRGKQGYLTWADTKQMPLTSRVIQETLRMASILSFTFREAVEDVEYKGYLIPKGWKVMPLFRNIHHSPEFFPDPQMFDPSRFEVPHKPNTFLPFGNGAHSCPGRELAKLEILILLHHLTTKYRWDVVGPDNGIQYGPFPVPMQGLPLKLSRKNCRQ